MDSESFVAWLNSMRNGSQLQYFDGKKQKWQTGVAIRCNSKQKSIQIKLHNGKKKWLSCDPNILRPIYNNNDDENNNNNNNHHHTHRNCGNNNNNSNSYNNNDNNVRHQNHINITGKHQMTTLVFASEKELIQHTVSIEEFKDLISEIFKNMTNFLAIRKMADAGNERAAGCLMNVNGSVVQSLNMMGRLCSDYKKKPDQRLAREVLINASQHFEQKCGTLSEEDAQLLSPFLQHMDFSLTSDEELQVVPLTADAAANIDNIFNNSNTKNSAISTYIGKFHSTTEDAEEYAQNAPDLREKQKRVAREHSKKYNQKRGQNKNGKPPSHQSLFAAGNGGKNVEFSAAPQPNASRYLAGKDIY
jgi:hypothetical protein